MISSRSASTSSTYRYYQPIYKNSNIILESESGLGALHLGDVTAAYNVRELKKNGITHVLTAAVRLGVNYKLGEIKHKTFPALDIDSYNLSKYFEDGFNFIEDGLRNGSVLVHCAAGISRSATIVIAYLMKKNNWSFDAAYKFVKKKRNVISPNNGFIKQLKNYQKKVSIKN